MARAPSSRLLLRTGGSPPFPPFPPPAPLFPSVLYRGVRAATMGLRDRLKAKLFGGRGDHDGHDHAAHGGGGHHSSSPSSSSSSSSSSDAGHAAADGTASAKHGDADGDGHCDAHDAADTLATDGVNADPTVRPVHPAVDRYAWTPIPHVWDEWNGTALDATKWHDHNPGWKGRKPGLFHPKNVRVQRSQLILTACCEDDGQCAIDWPDGYERFTTAFVRSKRPVLYGYFECRAKPMASAASSSFWFSHNTRDMWTEIDVFELARARGHECTYHMNAHVFRMPTRDIGLDENKKPRSHPAVWKNDCALCDDYHVFGLDWTPETITWVVDGRPVRSLPNKYWHQPLFMNFDSETMDGPNWFGLPDPAELPSEFAIDYVRAWTKTPL